MTRHDPGGRGMSELTLTVLQLGLLVLLWLFVLGVVGVLRGDLYGTRVAVRPPPRARQGRPAAPAGARRAAPAATRPPRPPAPRAAPARPAAPARRHRGLAAGHDHHARDLAHHHRPGRGLHARRRRRVRLRPARPDQPRRRAVGARGPRLHQRHLRPQGAGPGAGPAAGPGARPHRPDRAGAEGLVSIALRYAARSDVGLVRTKNEDSGYAGPHLLVVADGMGGHAGGDVASSLAVGDPGRPGRRGAGQHRGADPARRAAAPDQHRPAGAGPRSSPTWPAWAPRSPRCCAAAPGSCSPTSATPAPTCCAGGELVKVTTDHTYVQSLVEAGRITEEEAENHPQRNVVMRVLTGEHGDEPDLSVREGRPGDRWLLCSDGLSGFVSHDTLHDTLAAGDDPGTTAENLVRLAMRSGAPDNVTVIVGDVVDLDSPPSTAPQVVGRRRGPHPRPHARPPRPTTAPPPAPPRSGARPGATTTATTTTPHRAGAGCPGSSSSSSSLGLAGAAWGAWTWSQDAVLRRRRPRPTTATRWSRCSAGSPRTSARCGCRRWTRRPTSPWRTCRSSSAASSPRASRPTTGPRRSRIVEDLRDQLDPAVAGRRGHG